MPLSKLRNKERMKLLRLHKQHHPPQESKPVQPKQPITVDTIPELDAAGEVIYND